MRFPSILAALAVALLPLAAEAQSKSTPKPSQTKTPVVSTQPTYWNGRIYPAGTYIVPGTTPRPAPGSYNPGHAPQPSSHTYGCIGIC